MLAEERMLGYWLRKRRRKKIGAVIYDNVLAMAFDTIKASGG